MSRGRNTRAVNELQFGRVVTPYCLLMLDGVYTAATPWARPVFHPAPDLEDEGVADAVHADAMARSVY